MPSVSHSRDIPAMSIPSHFRPMDLVSCLAHGTRPFVSGMQRPVMPSVSHSRDIPTMSVPSHFRPMDLVSCLAHRDKTIRLWDAETGDAIGKPLEGLDGSRLIILSLGCISVSHKISDVVSTLGCTGYSQLLPSGWVINSDAEKLFWVPPWNRAGLCYPRNTVTISREGVSTTLDMSRFVHGTAWEKCRTG
jgi:WD40 repeat protein